MVPFNLNLAIRSILKNKVFSLLNISGLAISMAACLILALFIWNEWNHDTFHKNIDSIFRVTEFRMQDGRSYRIASTPGSLAPVLQQEDSEVINTVRFAQLTDIVKAGNKTYEENQIQFSDNSVFEVFSFPLVKGDPRIALISPEDIVITEAMADKYFGEQWRSDAAILNRTFTLLNHGKFKLAGIAKNLPANSSIRFDFLLPVNYLFAPGKASINWQNNLFHTYVQLKKGTNISSYEQKLTKRLQTIDETTKESVKLQPLKEQYLLSEFHFKTDWGKRSDIKYVRIFSGAGIILLFIALVNFINLTTARSLKRAMEVGMRKLNGASRGELVLQFLGESLITSMFAGLLALIFVTASRGWLSIFTGDVFYESLSSSTVLITYFTFIFLAGLFAGLYPALILSAFSPVMVISKSWINRSGKLFRQILVVGQFAISVTLITCTFFIYRQLNYIRQKDLGFYKEQLINLRLTGQLKSNPTLFQDELEKLPGVIRTAPSTISMVDDTNSGYLEWKGMPGENRILATYANIDQGFIPVLGLELLSGSNFSRKWEEDTACYIINASAAKSMRLTIKEVMNRPITFQGRKGKVIGVVKDFHFRPLKSGIEPFIFRYQSQQGYSNMFVKTQKGNSENLIKQIEKVYYQFEPDIPFRFTFLSDALDKSYTQEKRTASIIMLFAVLTIFIGCLGLFGLTIYSAERRIKEIGIRKVLGAGLSSIATLLTADFIRLVILGILIAIPIAWILTYRWLQQYAYRTEIEWWVFILVGILVIFIACITVSFQTLAAAKLNPIRNLRSE
ncbi:ABC transporter permease [Flavitalea sp.]|nr:ABC transporter permease [Flavitalea sp.]